MQTPPASGGGPLDWRAAIPLLALAVSALGSLAGVMRGQKTGEPMSRWGKLFSILTILFTSAFVVLFAITVGFLGFVTRVYGGLSVHTQGFLHGVGATGFTGLTAYLAWGFRQRAKKRRSARRQEVARQQAVEAEEWLTQRKEEARLRVLEEEASAKRIAAREAQLEAKERKANMDGFAKVYRNRCRSAFSLACGFLRFTGKHQSDERKAVARLIVNYPLAALNQAIKDLDLKLSDPLADLEMMKPLLEKVMEKYLAMRQEINDVGPMLLGERYPELYARFFKARAECMAGLEELRNFPGMFGFISALLLQMQQETLSQPAD